jgi:hypothetical protein
MKVTDLRRKLRIALAAGGLLASGSTSVHGAELNTNLVQNPGFEDVDPSVTCCSGATQVNGWADGSQRGFAYDFAQNYDNGGPLAGGGTYYFTPNGNATGTPDVTAPGRVSQNINVAAGPSGSLIATGDAAYKLGAFFSGYLTNGDFGTVHAEFLNAASMSLGTASVSANNVTTWTQNFAGGLVPVGTATVRLSVYGTPLSGGPDGYIDNVDFQVTNEVIQPALGISVNRDTGAITLSNQTGGAVNFKSYVITSAAEALDPANWVSIADNYDAGSPGPNQVDATHNWSELTDPTANGDLSEANLQSAGGASLAHTRSINLGNAGAWIQNPTEDLVFQYISGSQIVQGLVSFTGHGGAPFARGDLNVDNVINTADWMVFRANQQADLSSKSLAEAYRLGDLTGDRQNNHADFALFKSLYDAANGAGAFALMAASVPEPSTVVFALTAGLFATSPFVTRKRNSC